MWQFWHCSPFSERQLCGSSLYKMVWVETHRMQNSNQPKHKVWQTRKKMWRMSPSLPKSENANIFLICQTCEVKMRTLHIHGILHSRHSPLAAFSQNLNWKCEVKMRTLHTHGILHSRHSPLEAILPKSELKMPKVFNGFHGSQNSAGLIIRCNISKFYDVAMSIRVLLCT